MEENKEDEGRPCYIITRVFKDNPWREELASKMVFLNKENALNEIEKLKKEKFYDQPFYEYELNEYTVFEGE